MYGTRMLRTHQTQGSFGGTHACTSIAAHAARGLGRYVGSGSVPTTSTLNRWMSHGSKAWKEWCAASSIDPTTQASFQTSTDVTMPWVKVTSERNGCSLATLDTVVAGEPCCVTIDGRTFALVRTEAGHVFLFDSHPSIFGRGASIFRFRSMARCIAHLQLTHSNDSEVYVWTLEAT